MVPASKSVRKPLITLDFATSSETTITTLAVSGSTWQRSR